MRILFVTPPPYLPNRLHRNRSFDLIRILAKKHEVHLLSLTTKKEIPEEFREIRKACKSVKIIYHSPLKAMLNCLRFPFLPSEIAYCYSEKAKKEIRKIIQRENIDLVYLKRLRSAIYLCDSTDSTSKESRLLPRHLRGDYNRVILDSTDAMSMFYFRLYKQAIFPKKIFYLLEAMRYKRFEKTIMKKVKNWIVCSPVDQEYLQKFGRDVNIHLVPNPVDADYFSPSEGPFTTSKESRSLPRHLRGVANFSPSRWPKDSSKVVRNSLLFRGLMDKPVNIDACLFFVKEILPRVLRHIKDTKLFIVGPNPHRLIRKLHNGRDIFVTGFVKDIREYTAFTTISICPVRIASGTRFKILHAWALGRPVVSTTIGAEGLLYKKGENIAIADRPEEFAKEIITMLKNRKKYDKLAENGRKTIITQYSFKVINQRLESVFQNITLPRRHSGERTERSEGARLLDRRGRSDSRISNGN